VTVVPLYVFVSRCVLHRFHVVQWLATVPPACVLNVSVRVVRSCTRSVSRYPFNVLMSEVSVSLETVPYACVSTPEYPFSIMSVVPLYVLNGVDRCVLI
jgi:hypothetical protein